MPDSWVNRDAWKKLPRCHVGGRHFAQQARALGIVTAPNAQEALNRAASLFRIERSRYNKLMIKKIEERERERD